MRWQRATANVTVNGIDIDRLCLALAEPSTVTGHVVLDPVARSFKPETMRLSATKEPGSGLVRSAPPAGRRDFEFKSPAGLQLSLTSPPGWMIKSAFLNGQDALENGLEVRAGTRM